MDRIEEIRERRDKCSLVRSDYAPYNSTACLDIDFLLSEHDRLTARIETEKAFTTEAVKMLKEQETANKQLKSELSQCRQVEREGLLVRLPKHMKDFSDGYHTFGELYHHRAILFSVICSKFPDKSWKSKLHHDSTMFDDMFIVGINTAQGHATYHYHLEPYWNFFEIKELEKAPEWDGHTSDVAIERIRFLVEEAEQAQEVTQE